MPIGDAADEVHEGFVRASVLLGEAGEGGGVGAGIAVTEGGVNRPVFCIRSGVGVGT